MDCQEDGRSSRAKGHRPHSVADRIKSQHDSIISEFESERRRAADSAQSMAMEVVEVLQDQNKQLESAVKVLERQNRSLEEEKEALKFRLRELETIHLRERFPMKGKKR